MCEGFDRRPRRVSPGHPPGRNIAGWTLLRVDASARVAGKGAPGRELVDWERSVHEHWESLRFGELRVDSGVGHHAIEVDVFLGDIDAGAVRVELYADPKDGSDPVRQEMKPGPVLSGASRRCLYYATVPATRPAGDYTARIVPRHAGVAVPLECARILWQR